MNTRHLVMYDELAGGGLLAQPPAWGRGSEENGTNKARRKEYWRELEHEGVGLIDRRNSCFRRSTRDHSLGGYVLLLLVSGYRLGWCKKLIL